MRVALFTGLHTFIVSEYSLFEHSNLCNGNTSIGNRACRCSQCSGYAKARQTVSMHVMLLLHCAQHCKRHACRACGLVRWVSPLNDLRVSQWRHWKRRSELERALYCTVENTPKLRSCCESGHCRMCWTHAAALPARQRCYAQAYTQNRTATVIVYGYCTYHELIPIWCLSASLVSTLYRCGENQG